MSAITAPTPAIPGAGAPSPRLYFLDWLRILAFGLLVFYHVGMYYVSWDWHVKSPHASPALAPWMMLTSPWRMDLLFLVSGAATAFMLKRSGASGALLRQRARRLLLPLVFGMLVIVPPQSYFEVIRRFGFDGSYPAFMGLYLRGYAGFCEAAQCLRLPTWNHLWYLPYLMSYTALLWLLVRASPSLPARLAGALAPRVGGIGWLVLPVLLLAASRLALRGRFPETHALVDDWFLHLQQFPIFLIGALLAFAPSAWDAIAAQRRIALAASVAAWCAFVAVMAAQRGGPLDLLAGVPEPWPSLARVLAYSTMQWCAIVAAIGYARVHLDRDGAARRYLTDAVFPVYILHQTLIVVLSQAVVPLSLSPAVEAPLLIAATFALSVAGYEAVRRVRVLRPWFGLASANRSPSSAVVTA